MHAARPTKIQHWQLRDLVHCEDDEHVFCVSDRCTVLYDTRNNQAGASPRGAWGCWKLLLVCYVYPFVLTPCCHHRAKRASRHVAAVSPRPCAWCAQSAEIQKLSFTPTSLAVGSGFIAAGGQCSQVRLCRPHRGGRCAPSLRGCTSLPEHTLFLGYQGAEPSACVGQPDARNTGVF